MISTRKCNYCLQELPLSEFAADASCKRTQCKTCAKKETFLRKESRRLAGNPPTPSLGTPCDYCGRTDRKLVFDHDHDTLKFRGWLCQPCNRGLGALGDDLAIILKNTQRYINQQNQNVANLESFIDGTP